MLISDAPKATLAAASLPSRRRLIAVAVLLWIASNVVVMTAGWIAQSRQQLRPSLGAAYCRWDCLWYAGVVTSGYDVQPPHTPELDDQANWPFFPVLPLLAIPLARLAHVSAELALVIVAKIGLLAAIAAFLLLLEERLHRLSDYVFAGSLIAFNPFVIYAHAGYAEPIYFAACALAFWLLQRRRWIASGASAAVLSASRLVGVAFAVSYAWSAVQQIGWRRALRDRTMAIPLGLLLCPLGMVMFAMYLYLHTGDALGFEHAHLAWGKSPGNPLGVVLLGLRDGGWPAVWALTALGGLAAGLWLFKLRRADMGIYLLATILMPLSAGLPGTPRFVWWQPPLLYAVFRILEPHRRWQIAYVAISAVIACRIVFAWFSGAGWVV